MTLHQYLDTLKNKTVAVVGIGVSNTPWLRRLLQEGIRVTACDKRSRDALGAWRRSWKRPAAACSWGRTTYRA